MSFLFDNEEELVEEDFDDGDAGEVSAGDLKPPREAATILGYGDIEKQLLAAFNEGRMPHAIILSGLEGIGKSTFAFRIARFLLKHGAAEADAGPSLFGDPLPAAKPTSFDVPIDDPVAQLVASAGHNDLLIIERLFDEKKGRLQGEVIIEEVRRVTPFLRLTAARGGWRIVIVDDADTMNRNSQNALLKILEEPPTKTLLILVTHRVGALVPTIRSRCRVITVQPPDIAIFGQLLRMAEPTLSDTEVNVLYAVSSGSAGQGLKLLNEGGLEAVARFVTLLEGWPKWNWVDIHALADNISRPEQEDALQAFRTIMLWAAEAMVRAKARGENLPVPLDASAAMKIIGQYPLAALVEICENLREHFALAENANLDRRQAVLGAFSLLANKEAA
ncbi:MAG TPA: DNA polymerase III subunit delta' [Patescibacteria group bacterium]|nr:DNA polymerase III subunit delta' [Patescibacteria group bacterium]